MWLAMFVHIRITSLRLPDSNLRTSYLTISLPGNDNLPESAGSATLQEHPHLQASASLADLTLSVLFHIIILPGETVMSLSRNLTSLSRNSLGVTRHRTTPSLRRLGVSSSRAFTDATATGGSEVLQGKSEPVAEVRSLASNSLTLLTSAAATGRMALH